MPTNPIARTVARAGGPGTGPGEPSMSRLGAVRLVRGFPRSLARWRARLSSMSRIASHSNLIAAASLGKWPRS